ncbi:MAG: hypothetical protein JWP28_3083 [Phenylobacterium sp.]|uniref:FAD/NAD(P)-binding protein n=1 Tax=Phenylobacterium sp. TaxID=1871053 RepID=UPI0026021818|nr:FAD/NAD(P)-binding protein [Phenylobacterium sp.]MDB5499052.1 hypothetical protein [Phenylobacterium sp.]
MSTRDRTAPASSTVAVVGGGFSGLLTAIHLLQADPDLIVRLVERAPQFGRGRAYRTENPDHLLNVRVANMSAFPDRPDHFAAWLRARGDCAGPSAFVSRNRYGDYLQSLLREHVRDPDNAGRLLLEHDEAVDIEWTDGRQVVKLALGRSFEADATVLAVGSPPPSPPHGADDGVVASANYFAEPWTLDLASVPQGDVLVVGSGLTMIDAALSLAGEGRRLTALSRHGLLPRSHGPTTPSDPPEGSTATPLQALRTLRAQARKVGWREAVDGIRPRTAAIWMSWPVDERRRFLRHAQTWWDVHRHRMAPAVTARVSELIAVGQLEIFGSRLERIRTAGDGFEATFRRSADGHWITRRFTAVINCMGMRGSPSAEGNDLVARLARRGVVRADPLGLGLEVSDALQVVGATGAPTAGLFAVGPLTRGAFWETVATPDLRIHTARLARTIFESLRTVEAA